MEFRHSEREFPSLSPGSEERGRGRRSLPPRDFLACDCGIQKEQKCSVPYSLAGFIRTGFASKVDKPHMRKEVNTMNYSKPEVAVLGDASLLIQGGKQVPSDPDQVTLIGGSDCELDD